MTFIWHFNVIFKKLLIYKQINSGMPINDYNNYIKNLPLLRNCEPTHIIKLGESLHFISKNSENRIFLSEQGENYLNLSNPNSITEVTESQKEYLKNYILNNWILDAMKKFVIIIENKILIYKRHGNDFCRTLISMLKTIRFITRLEEEDFFELDGTYTEYWEENFDVQENFEDVFPGLDDYSDFWDAHFNGRKYTEEELIRNLEKQKKIGDMGEEIALEVERKIMRDYNRPEFLTRVKIISKDQVDAGFDLISVNEDGSPKYIEVKTTFGSKNRFFFSRNEYAKSIAYNGNYWIYFIYLRDKKCKMFNNIEDLIENEILILEPSLFEVNIKFQEFEFDEQDITEMLRDYLR